MIILGLLLVLGVGGLALAAIVSNNGVFAAPAGTIELFGYHVDATVGQVFLTGAAAGAVVILGILMLLRGVGRSARRRSATRRELAAQRQEVQDLQRKHDSVSSDLAAQRLTEDKADELEKTPSRR
jgi:hypothetical protein